MELEPDGIFAPEHDHAPKASDPILEQIEAALDEGREEDALELAEQALEQGHDARLDLLFLAGDALMAMGRAPEAEARFREVLAEDPTCPSSRCWLAMALYRQCRFADAEREVTRALQCKDPVVDSHVVFGLLLERKGQYAEADALFAKAEAVDAAKYPAPVRITRAQFDKEVRKAAKKLPRQFRIHLERVPVIVQDLPEESLLTQEQPPLDPDLLGLFDGVSLPETGEMDGPPQKPNYIYLFQRNLERAAKDPADLVEQIRITLWHELGHYLGFDEEDMPELGLE